MKTNERHLPFLNRSLLDLIFEHVYQPPADDLDSQIREFILMLQSMQEYNCRYRQEQYVRLFPLADPIVGPFETNSEGTDCWLALILAIRELYGMSDETLKAVLSQITVRK